MSEQIKYLIPDIQIKRGTPELHTKAGDFMKINRDKRKPCSPSCMCHVTHPCEKCGKQWDMPGENK